MFLGKMKTVGVIGLGIMGEPMAANLLKAGYEVIAYNRRKTPVERLVVQGAQAGASVREVARRSDVVLTVLPDTPDVEAVALGPDGVIENAGPNSIIIDMSTTDPALARRLYAEAQAVGVGALDAPVSGGQQGAIAGTLSVMVGGDSATFDEARGVLSAVGKTVVHVGPAGAGQTVKAANQLLVGGIIELVSEAIVFLEAHGVAMPSAIEVLSGGLAGNRVLETKAAAMVAREFKPGFRVDLHHKDMGILLGAARAAGVTLPLGAVVGELFTALRAQGGGALDHTALLRVVDWLSGAGKNGSE
jgi:2-hydroxy-3-oxopropionate reductase